MLIERATTPHKTPSDRNNETQIHNIRIGNTEPDFEIRNSFNLHLTDCKMRFGKTEVFFIIMPILNRSF